MAPKKVEFVKGDWIVHLHYGVGQIKSIEKKVLGDEKLSYYKAEAKNSLFWVPVDSPDPTRVRSIASKYKINQAIKTLKEEPVELSNDHNERKRHINEVMYDIALVSCAGLVRDLIARKSANRLNPSEEKALDHFTENLLLEWSVSMGYDMEKVQTKFQEVVLEIQAKVKVE